MEQMSINQINGKIKRIEGQIAEAHKSIALYQTWIDEAPSKSWETESNIKRYKSTIRDYEKKINKWEAQMAEFKGMLEGRIKEYPVVRQYVEAWKKACIDLITDPQTIADCVQAYNEMKAEQDEVEEKAKAEGKKGYSTYRERCDIEKKFLKRWDFVYNYLDMYNKEIDMERLERDYKYEADRKYNKFIEDCEYYVGEITDISGLTIGMKGDLNGFVIGTKGKAEVETISACGEIQRFHYRTLFKKVK